jgi:hypothetical protein
MWDSWDACSTACELHQQGVVDLGDTSCTAADPEMTFMQR